MSAPVGRAVVGDDLYGRRWLMLGLAALAQFASSSLQIGLGFLLPFVRDDLSLSTAEAGLLLSFFGIGVMLMAFPSGTATDTMGERRIVTAGLFIGSVMTLLAALQSSYPATAGLLLIAGLGIAPTHPAGSRLVLRLFPLRERGLALGVRQASVPVGGLLVAAMVAPLTTAISWRAGLGATSAVMLVASILVGLFLADPRQRRSGPARRFWSDVPKLLKNRDFAMANLATFLVYIAQSSLLSFLSLFVLQELGAGVAEAAIALAVVNASSACARLILGVVSDRFYGGRRGPPLILVQSLAIGAALVLFFMPTGVPLGALIAGCALAGSTMMGWNAVGMALVAESVGREGAGAAAGLNSALLTLVTIVLPPLIGLMIDATDTVRSVWLVAAAALALGTAATFRVRETKR
ncbi:MAG: MFS transporter [Chloroflexi bacterium]|nr:MFS transporter [Chloroflexota bacterium]